jgi:hypothetical protein
MNLSQFDTTIYSEEIYSVSEQDFDEVMQMIGAENEALEGYGEWSQELEQGEIVKTSHGPILINRDCAHKECLTTRCSKGATFQGIAI